MHKAPPFTFKADSELCEFSFRAIFMALGSYHLGEPLLQFKSPSASFKKVPH